MHRRMMMDRRMMREPRRMRRMDMGMHNNYPYDYGMMEDGRRRNAKGQYMPDRAYDMPHEQRDYGSFHEERGFRPVEAMGYFTGYYGGGQDMARGSRRDYRYDMRYDGNYPMYYRGGDYRYDYAGDYGENLSQEEIEHWKKKLMKEVDDKDKQFFETTNIEQRARQMGAEMKDYTPEELALTTVMAYTDYCKTLKKHLGNNMEVYVELAKDWLEDKDVAVKGGEKLAVYHDCIVEGEDD